jgi:hypothetical protein
MGGLKEAIAKLVKVRTGAGRRRLVPLLKAWLAGHNGDVRSWYLLACCYDFLGRERQAEPCYARVHKAWRALPAAARPGFFVGYGSTLRNNGKLALSAAVLRQGVRQFPGYPALKAFLALSLYSGKDMRGAAKALFGACLNLPAGAFDGYERALAHYAKRLK